MDEVSNKWQVKRCSICKGVIVEGEAFESIWTKHGLKYAHLSHLDTTEYLKWRHNCLAN